MGGGGSLPLIRPCGATFPQGGRQGLLLAAAQASAGRRGRRPYGLPGEWAAAGGRGGVGAPRPTDGDMETLWGLRGHPFPGRRAVGAGHARPGGLRGHPSMVRSVGRGLDPSAGVGCSGSLRGWLPGEGRQREPAPHPALRGHLPPRGKARAVVSVGDAAHYGLPGEGQQREVAARWGHPALRRGIWKRLWGLRGHPFPGRRAVGAGHARPGGLRGHPSMVRSVGRGLDPSAGVGGNGSLRGW